MAEDGDQFDLLGTADVPAARSVGQILEGTLVRPTSRAGKEASPSSSSDALPSPASSTALDLFEPEEITRPELNIAKWSNVLFVSPYLKKGLYDKRTRTFEVSYDGQRVEGSLTVTPHHEMKTLTTTSYRVFLALVQIWEHQGKPADGKIVFSGRQLAQLLGWKWGGATAERIREQLQTLRRTGISWLRLFKGEDGETISRVDDMSILGDGSYFDAKDRLGSEKFGALHRVVFGEFVRNNLVKGITKPINYRAYLSIENEAAANLYTQIDIYLSGKNPVWQRRSLPLLYEDLGMTGKRYEQKKHRLAKLKDLVKEVDGKELSTGKLAASIETTADGTDYKLVARRVARIVKERRPPRLANPTDEIPLIVDDIIEGLKAMDGRSKREPNPATIRTLAMWYSKALLLGVLAELCADYRGRIKKSPVQLYVAEVRRKVKEAGREWITDHKAQA